MNWTAGAPTTSGYYWWRESTGEEPCIVEVDIQRGTVLSLGTDEAPTLDEMEGEATAHWCCHDDLV